MIFAYFMDLYGHCPLELAMVRNVINTVNPAAPELLHEAYVYSDSDMVSAWYAVAVAYLQTQDRTTTLHARCQAENAMRSAWRHFLRVHKHTIPEVPPLPD